jgi:hypothetical protein
VTDLAPTVERAAEESHFGWPAEIDAALDEALRGIVKMLESDVVRVWK